MIVGGNKSYKSKITVFYIKQIHECMILFLKAIKLLHPLKSGPLENLPLMAILSEEIVF